MQKQRKRILSLAFVMALVTGCIGGYFALRPGNVMVSLDTPENGSLSFLGSDDLSMSFKKGKTVEVKINPDIGYEDVSISFITENETTNLQMKNGVVSFDAEKSGKISAVFKKYTDFSSKQLIVMADNNSDFVTKGNVIGQYGNMYIIQFNTVDEAKQAYSDYKDTVSAVEPNTLVQMAAKTDAINDSINPINTLNSVKDSEIVKNSDGVIALIDTGTSECPNVIDRISIIDDALAGNGHGDAMCNAIISQDVNAKILSIRAINDAGYGTVASVVAAMEYAINQNVDIINLSLYTKTTLASSVIEAEINKATEAGIVVVGAAGNDGADVKDYMPGNVADAYIIGAANESGFRQPFSNYGSAVDYNVSADSTSKASALFTGFISANGLGGLDNVLNQGLIFATDYRKDILEFTEDDFTNGKIIDVKTNNNIKVTVTDIDAGKYHIYHIEKDNGTIVVPKTDSVHIDVCTEDEMQSMSFAKALDTDGNILIEGKSNTDVCGITDGHTHRNMFFDVSVDGLKLLEVATKQEQTFSAIFDEPANICYYEYDLCGDNCLNDHVRTNRQPFGASLADDVVKAAGIDAGAIIGPGQVFNGRCHFVDENHGHTALFVMSFSDDTGLLNGQSFGRIDPNAAEGNAAEKEANRYFKCLQHGQEAPNNVDGTYTATVTSWDPNTGNLGLHIVCTKDGTSTGYQQSAGDISLQIAVAPPVQPKGRIIVEKYSNDPNTTNWYIESSSVNYYNLQNAVFDVYNADHTAVITTITTGSEHSNENGWHTWGASGEFDPGSYCVHERTAPADYHQDTVCHPVTIGAGGGDVTCPVRNNPKLCQLNVKKYVVNDYTLNNNCYTVEGASYHVKNMDRNMEWDVLIKSDGTSDYLENIPPGSYKVWENQPAANSGYIRNDEPLDLTLAPGESKTAHMNGIHAEPNWEDPIFLLVQKRIEANEIEPGESMGNISNLSGIVFQLDYYDDYYTTISDIPATAKASARFKTNEDGYLSFGDPIYEDGSSTWPYINSIKKINILPLGTYVIREISSINGLKVTTTEIDNAYAFMVKERDGKLVRTALNGTKWSDHPSQQAPFVIDNDPVMGGVMVIKVDRDTGESVPQGNGSLEGIKYKITNKSANAVVVDGRKIDVNKEVMTIMTKEIIKDGENVYAASTGNKTLPYGTYLIEEISADDDEPALANDSYKKANWSATFDIEEDGKIVEIATKNSDPVVRGGVKIQKADADTGTTPQGNASFKNIQYEIINKSVNPVVVDGDTYENGDVVKVIKADEAGIATTDDDTLPYGCYTIREKAGNASYAMPEDGWEKTFNITENGVIVDLTTSRNDWNKDPVVRGGVKVQKADADRKADKTEAQGDGSLAGVTYEIYNRSRNPVVVGLRTYESGELVAIINTDNNGVAKTSNNWLPYGLYTIKETSANSSYNMPGTTWTREFRIRENGEYVEFTDDETWNEDPVKRGGVTVYKMDNDSGEMLPQGDATLEGVQYDIYNRSSKSVVVNGFEFAPNELVMTIRTEKQETGNSNVFKSETYIATTGEKKLPYGTYEIIEHSTPKSYINAGWRQTFKIRRDGQIETYDLTNGNKNPVVRGSLSIIKVDADTLRSEPQGDADLANTIYSITNKSKYPVYVNNTWYYPNDKIIDIATSYDAGKNQYIATLSNLPVGTYKVAEITPPLGYHTENYEEIVELRPGRMDVTLERKNADPVWRGAVIVGKVDADWHTSNPQGDATLNGVEYTIYNRSQRSVVVYIGGQKKEVPVGGIVTTITTSWNEARQMHTAQTPAKFLPYGTYEIVETRNSTGYLNAGWRKTFQIRTDGQLTDYTGRSEWNENPVQRGAIIIGKVDRETGQYISLGEAELEGATFEVINRSLHPVYVNGKTYNKDDVCLTMATEEMEWEGRTIYAAFTGERTLPYGTYEIRETGSGVGYLYDSKSKAYTKTVQVRNDGQIIDLTNEGSHHDLEDFGDVIGNQVIRQDFHFQKKDDNTQDRMGNVAFLITSLTTGEKHIIVTDENGTWGSASTHYENTDATQSGYRDHTQNTNANDPTSPISNGSVRIGEDGKWYVADSSKLDSEAGTWFAGLSDENITWKKDSKGRAYYTVNDADYYPNDDLRAFPYDRYLIEELACEANEGYNLITTHVTLHRYTKDHDGLGINLDYGTLFDTAVTLDTYLTFNTTGKMAPCRDDVDIIDQVAFSGLSAGDYELASELWLLSEDGKTAERKVAETRMAMNIKGSFMMRNVEFNLDTRPLGGRTLVAYERIYKDGQLVVEHADPTDVEQQIKIIKIETTMTGDLGHMSYPTKAPVTLTDKVDYDGLKDGRYYTVTGMLVDKETGLPLVDGDGNEVMKTQRFVASGEKGSFYMPFTFSGVDLQGKTLVAYETLTRNNIEYAVHDDLNDEDQSVHYPAMDTYAADGADGNKELAEAEGQTVLDAVKVTNILDGYQYKLEGELHVKNKDGVDEGIIATAETVWEGADGNQAVRFENIDASKLGGKDLVVFQNLYGREGDNGEWVLLGDHGDINDMDQTVHVPHIGTTMLTNQGLHEIQVPADGMVTLTDTVSYENLTPGHEYVVYGTLHTTADGEATDVTASAQLTPEASSGAVDVTFTFDARKYSGQSVTMFESLYSSPKASYTDEWAQFFNGLGGTFDKTKLKKEWITASHEDIKDEGQTIHFVEVETTLVEENGVHMYQVTGDGMVSLTDTVKYTNLIPGSIYTITGTLHLQNVAEDGTVTDGGVVKDKDGNDITQSITFTASSANGSIDMPFTFDASQLSGRTVTAYESISRDNITFAAHADITDEGQSEHFIEIGTTLLSSDGLHLTQMPKGKDKMVTLTDTVAFTNLIPGLEYEMTGTLHIQEVDKNGSVYDAGTLKNDKGEDITETVKFKPKTPNGSIDVEFKVDASELNKKTVVAYETLKIKDIAIATHEEIDDEGQAVHFADLSTESLTEEGLKEIQLREGEDANVHFTDTVTYENLIPGLEYKLTGTLHLQEKDKDGKVTDGGVLTDTEGNALTGTLMESTGCAVTGSQTFVPKTADGSIEMAFDFDASGLYGKTLVIYEAIAYTDVQFASHEDITEEGQSIYFVDMGTEAFTEDGLKITQADENLMVTITDSVWYKNLIPGKTYTIDGTLHVQDTDDEGNIIDGGVAKDGDGNDITGSTTFTAEKPDGSVDIIFTFDSSKLVGKTVVAFESLTRDDITFAVHADIMDEAQSINLMGMDTTALADNGLHLRQITEDKEEFITFTDTVSYTNIIPGMKYKVHGTVYDTDTGIQITDSYGHPVESEATFTPDMADGSIELTFKVKVEDIIGRSITVYEKMHYGDIQIARHEELDDEDQTIHFVDIGTTATTENGLHEYQVSRDGENVTITDRVRFENLIPGLEYTMDGVLQLRGMDEDGNIVSKGAVTDAEGNDITGTLTGIGVETDADEVTGEAVSGEAIEITGGAIEISPGAITGSLTFVPNVPDGYVDMEFTFDASELGEDTAVAFEYLSFDGVMFAKHEDIRDEEQSIHFVDIATKARTKDGIQELQVPADKDADVTITDTVSYKNLVPGRLYTMTGTLHLQDVAEDGTITDAGIIKGKDGNGVTSTVSFVPTEADGKVELNFTFNASKLGGKTVVAFESLSCGGTEFAVHADITDKEQAVHFIKLDTTALTKDGLHMIQVPAGEDKTVTITDTVSYENLIPGNEYTVEGTLHFKRETKYKKKTAISDGGKLVDASEKAVTAKKTFVAEKPDGSVDLTFTFDAYPLAGETLVAFETMSCGDVDFASHADIKDEDQSIHFVKIKTSAVTQENKHTVKVPADGDANIKIIDTITYENLVPGLEYTVDGTLHVQSYDKAGKIKDGGELKDASGNTVTAHAVFTPKKADGSVDATFVVNTADMPKGTVVAFETISYDGRVVAEHKDIRDKEQSVKFQPPVNHGPEETPGPSEAPKPTGKPGETPNPSDKPDGTPNPSNKPAGPNETLKPTDNPSDNPGNKPEPTGKPSETPNTTDKPNEPNSSTKPTVVPDNPSGTSKPAGTSKPTVWELVRTGEGSTILIIIIALALMSGGGYFFIKKTGKGRSLADRVKERLSRK